MRVMPRREVEIIMVNVAGLKKVYSHPRKYTEKINIISIYSFNKNMLTTKRGPVFK